MGIKMKKKVILVFKTHVDVGFTGLAEEIIKKYSSNMLHNVIKTCEGTKHMGDCKYVWTMPSWVMLQSLNPELVSEELLKKADELIKEGQVVWHSLPFTTHTEFCGLEEYIRGFSYAKTLNEKYGKNVISAKMTDVPGHT